VVGVVVDLAIDICVRGLEEWIERLKLAAYSGGKAAAGVKVDVPKSR
jgi:hypothetical protein